MEDRGIPRQDHEVYAEGTKVGAVTSGTYSPLYQNGIGMGYVERQYRKSDTPVEINIRGVHKKAKVVAARKMLNVIKGSANL
jgi:aminomethyltransferase